MHDILNGKGLKPPLPSHAERKGKAFQPKQLSLEEQLMTHTRMSMDQLKSFVQSQMCSLQLQQQEQEDFIDYEAFKAIFDKAYSME